jgi:hypothetical protein
MCRVSGSAPGSQVLPSSFSLSLSLSLSLYLCAWFCVCVCVCACVCEGTTVQRSLARSLDLLQAWDKEQADRALDAYAVLSTQLLHNAGGYLVELTSSGLCLAAFRHPLDAVAWGAGLIEVMKHRQWDEVCTWRVAERGVERW